MYHNNQPCISIHITICVPVSQDVTQYLKIYHKMYLYQKVSPCIWISKRVRGVGGPPGGGKKKFIKFSLYLKRG